MQDYRDNEDNPLLEEVDVKVRLAQVQPYPDYGLSDTNRYNLSTPQVPITITPHIPAPLNLPPAPNVYENRFENVVPYQTPSNMWEMPSRNEPGLMPANPDWIPKWQLGERTEQQQ